MGFPVTKQDIEEHFSTHGSGKITEIKLMNGFGFIEYEDAMDARDVVPAFRELPSWPNGPPFYASSSPHDFSYDGFWTPDRNKLAG
ncbi:hypothetical protein EYZ11_005514 [Aspergillus tanneri]|uniref:RRM domain-containing protein n=1 Tax=Aspergillus tanneri TaxID=1220188 RepID=A0A4S3JI42_9EURO|nr:hypothetical protein EYZ11_005514 [Aspergillus tanneri]